MKTFGTRFEWAVRMADGQLLKGQQPIEGPVFTVSADLPEGELRSIKGRIALDLPDDAGIFLNGYQSWTECPEYTKSC